MLISPEELVRMGLLTEDDIKLDYEADEDRVDFVKVEAYKIKFCIKHLLILWQMRIIAFSVLSRKVG